MLASLFFGPGGDPEKKGRKGNANYARELYVEAANEYRLGVWAIQEEGPGPVYSGLLNNLGAALYREGDTEEAGIAFASAARMATTPEDLVRASYNAGNAAAANQQLEAALAHYRKSLLADPANADAKFNYEFVKRQLEEGEQQENEQDSEGNDENQDQQQNDQEQDSEQEQQQNNQDHNSENQNQEREQQQNEREREDPTKLSEEEAHRILQALQNEEEQLLRQVQKMKTRPRRVEKDW